MAKGVNIDFNANLIKFDQGINKAVDKLNQFNTKVDSVSKFSAKAFGLIGASFAGIQFGSFIKGAIDSADKIQKLSIRLGASTEALSQYRYVAEKSGVTFETLTMGWQRMTRRIAEAAAGTGEAKNALRELGLSAVALSKLKPEDQFEAIADAIGSVGSQSDKVRLAMKLFDSEGVSLIQTMQGGSQAIRETRQELDELGGTITQSVADNAAEFKDTMAKLDVQLQNLAIKTIPIATAAIGALSEEIDSLKIAGDQLGRFIFDIFNESGIEKIERYKQEVESLEKSLINSLELDKAKGQGISVNSQSYIDRIAFLEREIAHLEKVYGIQAQTNSILIDGGRQLDENNQKLDLQLNLVKELGQYADGFVADIFDQTDNITRQNAELSKSLKIAYEYLDSIGLTSKELGELGVLRLKDARATAKQSLEIAKKSKLSNGEIELLEAQITLYDQLIDVKTKSVTKQAAVESAKEAAKEWEKTADTIRNSIVDALMDGFNEGKSVAENFRDTIENMFKTMVLRPVIEATVTGGLNAVGLGASGQSGIGGIFDGLSSANSAYNVLSGNGFIGGALGYGANMSAALAGGAGIGQASMLAAQTAEFGLAGAQLTGQALGSTGAASTMAAAAPYALAAFGVMAAMELFDGGKPPGYEQMGSIDLSNNALGAGGYAKGSEKYSDANRQAADAITAMLAGVNAVASDVFDKQLKAKLAVNVSDRVDRLQSEGLWFDGALRPNSDIQNIDDLAQYATETLLKAYDANVDYYKALVTGSEKLAETFIRVETTLRAFTDSMDVLGYEFSLVDDLARDAALRVVEMAGGIEQYAASVAFYYDNFISEQEKTQKVIEQSIADIKDFNKEFSTVILNKESLRLFADSLDMTTKAGQDAYVAVLQLAPALQNLETSFKTLRDSLIADANKAMAAVRVAVQSEISKITESLSALIRVSDSLGSTIVSLRPSEYFSEVDRKQARAQIAEVLEIARQTGQIPDLEEIADSLAILKKDAKDQFATRTAYLLDQARTANELRELKGIADEQIAVEQDRIRALEETLERAGERMAAALGEETLSLEEALYSLEEALYSLENSMAGMFAQLAAALASGFKIDMGLAAQAGDSIARNQAVDFGLATGIFSYGGNSLYSYASGSDPKSGNLQVGDNAPISGNILSKYVGGTIKNGGAKSIYDEAVANDISSQQIDAFMGWTPGTANKFARAGGLPSFATGGLAKGWSVVGEQGPELVNFSQPSRVYSSSDSAGMFGGVTDELKALREEVIMLRAEAKATATNTFETKKILKRVTPDGASLKTSVA